MLNFIAVKMMSRRTGLLLLEMAERSWLECENCCFLMRQIYSKGSAILSLKNRQTMSITSATFSPSSSHFTVGTDMAEVLIYRYEPLSPSSRQLSATPMQHISLSSNTYAPSSVPHRSATLYPESDTVTLVNLADASCSPIILSIWLEALVHSHALAGHSERFCVAFLRNGYALCNFHTGRPLLFSHYDDNILASSIFLCPSKKLPLFFAVVTSDNSTVWLSVNEPRISRLDSLRDIAAQNLRLDDCLLQSKSNINSSDSQCKTPNLKFDTDSKWKERTLNYCLQYIDDLQLQGHDDLTGKKLDAADAFFLPKSLKKDLKEAYSNLPFISAIKSSIPPVVSATPISRSKAAGLSTKKSLLTKSQPIMFRSTIKSSGYTSKPWQKPTAKHPPKQKSSTASNPASVDPESYAISGGAEIAGLALTNGVISSLAYSPDGAQLCSASSDKSIRCNSLTSRDPSATESDPRRFKGLKLFLGHNFPVQSLHWNSRSSRFLSSSKSEVILWDAASQASPLLIQNSRNLPTVVAQTSDIAAARFCSQDRFIVYAIQNQLHVNSYFVEGAAKKDTDPKLYSFTLLATQIF